MSNESDFVGCKYNINRSIILMASFITCVNGAIAGSCADAAGGCSYILSSFEGGKLYNESKLSLSGIVGLFGDSGVKPLEVRMFFTSSRI